MRIFDLVDLSDRCNAFAATSDDDRRSGRFNAWGNSYPQEELRPGSIIQQGGVPFLLPRASQSGDHLVAFDTGTPFSFWEPAKMILLLCAGEMGDQELCVRLWDTRGFCSEVVVWAGHWLRQDKDAADDRLDFTHLHYPGGYELDSPRPVLWRVTITNPRRQAIARLGLGVNPLFHLFAITCIRETNGAN